MSKKAKKILAVIILLVLVAASVFAYVQLSPKGSTGDKTITVLVIHGDSSQKEFSITTDAESLQDALEPEGLIEGEEGPYGLFIKTVDGETADDSKQQWWCITKGGESLMTGISDTMIVDGEQYELTLTVGW